MARKSLIVYIGGEPVKLRLTMRSQKNLTQRFPEAPVLSVLTGAIDDLEMMEAVLTEALNWDGNDNHVHSGEELYDLLVDNGYEGQIDFMELMLDLAHNSGLLTQDQKEKLLRKTGQLLEKGFDWLDEEYPAAEGEESPENPPQEFLTL